MMMTCWIFCADGVALGAGVAVGAGVPAGAGAEPPPLHAQSEAINAPLQREEGNFGMSPGYDGAPPSRVGTR